MTSTSIQTRPVVFDQWNQDWNSAVNLSPVPKSNCARVQKEQKEIKRKGRIFMDKFRSVLLGSLFAGSLVISPLPAFAVESEHPHDIHHDRRDIRHDRQDVHADHRDIHKDRTELHKDYGTLRQDRMALRNDIKNGASAD